MAKEKPLYLYLIVLFGLISSTTYGERTGKPTLAVFDFTVSQTVTGEISVQTSGGASRIINVGVEYQTSLLNDKFVTALAKTQKVSVVERKKLASLREETQLTQAGLTDPNKSVEFGKLLGADYFLFGTLSMLDGKMSYATLPYNLGVQRLIDFLVGADIRIVETKTGKIIAAKSQKVKKTKKEANPLDSDNTIPVEFQHEAYDDLVQRLVATTIDTLFPIKVANYSDNVAYLNRPNLEPGKRYEVVRLGEVIRDPDTGEVLGQVETKVAIVKVLRGMEKFSTAEVVEWFTPEKTIPQGSLCRTLLPSDLEPPKKEQLR